MSRPFSRSLVIFALVIVAFAMGQLSGAGGGDLHAAGVEPQGRGTRPPPVPTPSTTALPTEPTAAEPLIYGGDSGQSASANGFIAVTGSYGVGTSVLYVIDTVSRQLAVYEARGGSPGGRRLLLVGARRIDLDLQLEGYNDESEFSYRDLSRRFERISGQPSTDSSGASTGSERPGRGNGVWRSREMSYTWGPPFPTRNRTPAGVPGGH